LNKKKKTEQYSMLREGMMLLKD